MDRLATLRFRVNKTNKPLFGFTVPTEIKSGIKHGDKRRFWVHFGVLSLFVLYMTSRAANVDKLERKVNHEPEDHNHTKEDHAVLQN